MIRLNCLVLIIIMNFTLNVFAYEHGVDEVLVQINGVGTWEQLQHVVEENLEILNLDVEKYDTLTEKSSVWQYMFNGRPYPNIDVFKSKFDVTIVLNEISRAQSLLECQQIFETNANMLGLDMMAFNALTDSGKSNVFQYLIEHDFQNVDELKYQFDIAVVLAKINYARWSELESIIISNVNILDIRIEEYNSLSSENQVEAMKSLSGRQYRHIEEFQDFFNHIIDELRKNQNNCPSKPFRLKNAAIINTSTTTQQLSFDVENLYYDGVTEYAYIAQYDADKKLQILKRFPKSIAVEGSERITESFDIPEIKDGYTYKMFVWDNNLIPLSYIEELSANDSTQQE